ncbi:uncharacterized protein MELLADRAFT_114391 [Melampsora larici-populina 98AG31]|uniref:Zn(2)-C6 fungal-type domain-containing protein n=1 Tax=Melampsora larici-populina (strain 98AG31 / pathotype 3-4-7) TaxID=747676 RepID=F4SDA1_MELLP|nr:uncharacterized protein MELLADRAFT_114391 [Melampsora larici-populina 98AG31]EGF97373.1 hypothetical protein MELLADRAFT_114391 [Melampsora larici-populina 98AG31]
MASHGHPGQIKKNSSSPNVVGLNANKAPSISSAKPRFRSRTGCWTCRRRKVKCDERGRNSETVAYGGPLSTASGCKRCEDSGRPCHGYGAHAPNRPLLHSYAASTPGDLANNSTPFYTLGNSTQEHPSNFPYFSHYMSASDSSPSIMSDLASWSRSSDSLKVAEQYPEQDLHAQHLRLASSTSAAAPNLASTPGTIHSHPHTLITPPLDMRRFSVPTYPTWHSSAQERHQANHHHPGDSRDSFYLHSAPRDVGNLNNDGIFQADGTIRDNIQETPFMNISLNTPLLHRSNGSNANFSSVRPHDPDMRPNTQSTNRPHLSSVDFGRPHTSSGVTLPHVNNTHLASSRNYRSPVFQHPEVISGIPESAYDSSVSPTTTHCSELGRNGWPDSMNGSNHSKLPLQPFNPTGPSLPGFHSPTMSKPLSPITQRTSASQDLSLLKPVSPIDASNACSLKPRYDFYSPSKGMPSDTHSRFPLSGANLHSPSHNGNFHGPPKMEYGAVSIDSHHLIGSDMKKQSSSTLEVNGGSKILIHPPSYVDSFESGMSQAIPDRKNSTSSSRSSLSTFDHGSSPHISLTGRPSTNHPCSPSDASSSSSPGSTTQLHQNHYHQPTMSKQSSSMNMFEVLQTNNHTNWNPMDAHVLQEPVNHEFSIHQGNHLSVNPKNDSSNDDSPVSTANSTFSCPGRNQYEAHGSPGILHHNTMIEEPAPSFSLIYKFPPPETPLPIIETSQHFSVDSSTHKGQMRIVRVSWIFEHKLQS